MFAMTFKGPKFWMSSPTSNPQFAWFDRSVIRTRWPKINKNPLQHAGNLVMRIARGSIKRRSKLRGKPSMPGTPPYSRRPGSVPPFKMIYSVPFNFGTSVIVGMVGFGGNAGGTLPPPGLQEHGGTAMRNVFLTGGRNRSKRTGRWLKKRINYKRQLVKYPKRPFMMPALRRVRQVLPSLWLNSVSHE